MALSSASNWSVIRLFDHTRVSTLQRHANWMPLNTLWRSTRNAWLWQPTNCAHGLLTNTLFGQLKRFLQNHMSWSA